MANKKITQLTELATTPAVDDVLPIVDIDAGTTKKITTANLLSAVYVQDNKAVTIENPSGSEDIEIFFTKLAITVTQLSAVLSGASTPSVTYTIRHDPDRSAVGNEVVTGGSIVTSESTGDIVTVFNDATIPVDSWIWLETTAQSGTVTSINVTIDYTFD